MHVDLFGKMPDRYPPATTSGSNAFNVAKASGHIIIGANVPMPTIPATPVPATPVIKKVVRVAPTDNSSFVPDIFGTTQRSDFEENLNFFCTIAGTSLKQIQSILRETGALIAGSSTLAAHYNPSYEGFIPNDIDIWMSGTEDSPNVEKMMMSLKLLGFENVNEDLPCNPWYNRGLGCRSASYCFESTPSTIRSGACSVFDVPKKMSINLILCECKELTDVFRTFDLDLCQIFYDGLSFWYPREVAKRQIVEKVLCIYNEKCAQPVLSRLMSYSRRGFTLTGDHKKVKIYIEKLNQKELSKVNWSKEIREELFSEKKEDKKKIEEPKRTKTEEKKDIETLEKAGIPPGFKLKTVQIVTTYKKGSSTLVKKTKKTVPSNDSSPSSDNCSSDSEEYDDC
jgi:hypothetical protein